MSARLALGIDVGGTTIKTVLADASGRRVLSRQDPTPYGEHSVVAAVARVVAELDEGLARGRVHDGRRAVAPAEVVRCVGVDVPGIVDESTGTAVLSVNLGWRDVPMRERLEAALGRPVSLGHDVRSGAWAEARWGRAAQSCLYLAVGTGVAAAVLIEGRPVVTGGWAGEVGQMLVPDPDDPGRLTRLEAVASAGAVARRWSTCLPETVRDAVLDAGAEGVTRALRHGDAQARRVWDTALDALADALARTACTLGPLDVVIGGGLVNAGEDLLLAPLRQRIAELLVVSPPPRVLAARLGSWSQALGSAGRALEVR